MTQEGIEPGPRENLLNTVPKPQQILQHKPSPKQYEQPPDDGGGLAKPPTLPRYEPPDGGYGWIVVVGNFIISFLIVGMFKSLGIIFREIYDQYPELSSFIKTWLPAMCICLSFSLCKYTYTLLGCYFF